MFSATIADLRAKIGWKDIFFGALVALYGMFLLGLIAVNLARVYKARFWRETSCTILKIGSENKTGNKGPFNQEVKISYVFEYAGEKYTGDQYDIVFTLYSKTEIADLVAAHQPPAPIVCYFDPRDPRESVIRRDIGIWTFAGYCVVPISVFGLAWLIFHESFSLSSE